MDLEIYGCFSLPKKKLGDESKAWTRLIQAGNPDDTVAP